MCFERLIHKLKEKSVNLFNLLADAESESVVLDILSSMLDCEKNVKFCGFPVLIVDLLCGNIGIEVEFNKQPHMGIHQVIAYKVYLGLKPVLIHVINYYTLEFENAFKKILKSLKSLNIKGILISIDRGEIIAIK